jgi:TPR repeat protein
MHSLNWILACLLTFAASAPTLTVAAAAELDKRAKAETSATQPDDAKLVRERKAAHAGDAPAQYQMGRRYEHGVGVAKDAFHAVGWYRKAAAQGHARAQWRYGDMLGAGAGIAQDKMLGAQWLQRAADQGLAEAQAKLALGYAVSWGVPEDEAKAFGLYLAAAKQGLAEAQQAVGFSYWQGRGVGQDHDEAFKWVRRSAHQGDATAQRWLATMYYEGEGTPKDLALARKWYAASAAQGDLDAQLSLAHLLMEGTDADRVQAFAAYRKLADHDERTSSEWPPLVAANRSLSMFYAYGVGTPRDDGKVIESLANVLEYAQSDDEVFTELPEEISKIVDERAAAGDLAAFKLLGAMHASGHGRSQDAAKSVAWYRKAAEQGDTESQIELSYAYTQGEGVSQDPKLATEWLAKAARTEAALKVNLAHRYERGEGVPKDERKAFRTLREVVAGEDGWLAYDSFARAYARGIGVKRDPELAVHWLRKAVELDSPHAACELAKALRDGSGTTRDHAAAYRMFVEAGKAVGCEDEIAAMAASISAEDLDRALSDAADPEHRARKTR